MLTSCCTVSFLNPNCHHWLTGFVCLCEAGKQQPSAQAAGRGWLSKAARVAISTAEPLEVLLVSFFHQSESSGVPRGKAGSSTCLLEKPDVSFSPSVASQAVSQSSPGLSVWAAQGWSHAGSTVPEQSVVAWGIATALLQDGYSCHWLQARRAPAVGGCCALELLCPSAGAPPAPCVPPPQLLGYRGDGADGAGDNSNGGDRWQINS